MALVSLSQTGSVGKDWPTDDTSCPSSAADLRTACEWLLRTWTAGPDPNLTQALGITMPAVGSLRIHPDGRRILLVARSPGPGGEVWAIDNVLSNLNARD